MIINKVSLIKYEGKMQVDGVLWEDRLATPLDIYEQYANSLDATSDFVQSKNGELDIEQIYLVIETENKCTGISGPINENVAFIIAKQLKSILIGKDAFATELIWDQMYRKLVHGRQGDPIWAISFVDCALWDLKGKALNQPVYKLLGGATVNKIPAYASMLGYNVLDMNLVKKRALAYKSKGFTAQKWFFRYGPAKGIEGLKKNIELVKTLRETLGDDYDLMFDCWQSMDVPYILSLAEAIKKYNPKWLEECAMPDRIESYVRIKNKINIPLAGAEHHYTRWGMNQFISQGALDIIQADPHWCGGISEMMKISALCSTHDLILIPHAGAMHSGVHFSFSQSPAHTPLIEYLVKWMPIMQFFVKEPVAPNQGFINVPEKSIGLGVEIDSTKIISQEYVFN
ncbi:MAG TPA: mandelate racemase/muconate lactonizing protein [Alphaproteobacteria bacterium]|nr:mandelate racemase/muconate lactonizing protein [Alphaproteobacteria bacterium]